MNDVSIHRTALPEDTAELRAMLEDYFAWADDLACEHFEELDGIDPAEAAAADLQRLSDPEIPRPLVVAREGDRIVGFVQMKRLDETTAEVKRLYVEPTHRGEGIGRALAETLLAEASAEGVDTLRLGVGPYLERARALYEDLGFEYTPPYDETQAPEVMHDDWCFMRLSLEE